MEAEKQDNTQEALNYLYAVHTALSENRSNKREYCFTNNDFTRLRQDIAHVIHLLRKDM